LPKAHNAGLRQWCPPDLGTQRTAGTASRHQGDHMPYLIIAHDHPGMDAKREQVREAHRAYLAAKGAKLLASGALLGADGRTVEGGASLLDTESYDEASRFESEDPYTKAGIRARVEIVPWRLRWWMGRFDADGHRPSRGPSSSAP
jgi:uncharacterized protein YciI